jgi:hypothetical protein
MPPLIRRLLFFLGLLASLGADANDILVDIQRDVFLLDPGNVSLELVRLVGLLRVRDEREERRALRSRRRCLRRREDAL